MSGGGNEKRPPAGKREGAPEGDRRQLATGEKVPETGGARDHEHLLPDPDAAVAFLEAWRPGGPWVLTAIEVDPLNKDAPTPTATLTSPDAVRRWIHDHSGGRWNLYFTPNVTRGPVRKKPSKGDMAAAVALFCDVDPRVAEPLDPERARIARLFDDWERDGRKLAFPRPSVTIDSGGGMQGFFLLAEPVPLDGDGVEEVEARGSGIRAAVDGDAVQNVDRVMRLPGTVNWPSAKKRRAGRVPRLARVVEAHWDRRYRLEDFPEWRAVPSAAPAGRAAAPAKGVMLDDLPNTVSDKCRQVIVRGHDPDDPERWDGRLAPDGSWQGDRSKAVWWVTCELVRAGVDDATISGILLDPDYAISGHVRDQKGAERYAQKQVRDAREEVDNNFDCDKDGNPYSNSQRNVRVALRRLGVKLRYDMLAGRATVEGLEGFGPNLDDGAMTRLWLAIDEQFKFRPQIEFFDRVLSDYARRNAFHPVIDYLGGLRWDGVGRIDRWLTTYGGAAENAYTSAVGALMLVAAVRRVRQPGVKFDEMLVLESAQGKDKSSALKVLAVRDEWFTDDLPLNAEGKRVIEAFAGKWIVEAGELKGMKQGGAAHLKSFLSRTHDRGRLSYDRREREVGRQVVIFGTTNDGKYLRDTTGNRRFWPVAVGMFDIDALRRDRDQLWAEAAAREAGGASIRLSKDLWAAAGEEQDARRVEDPFFETLHSSLGEELEGKVRAEDAWRIVGKPRGMRTQDDNDRLGDAMRRLGFERKQRRFGGRSPEWCYIRGGKHGPRLVPRFGPDGELEGLAEVADGEPDPEPWER